MCQLYKDETGVVPSSETLPNGQMKSGSPTHRTTSKTTYQDFHKRILRSAPKNVLTKTLLGLLTLSLLSMMQQAEAACFAQVNPSEVGKQGFYTINYSPTNAFAATEEKIRITIPNSYGLSELSGDIPCFHDLALGQTVSPFTVASKTVNGVTRTNQPTCTGTIIPGTPNTIQIVVTDLDTTTDHASYEFSYIAQNPPSAVIIPQNTIKCEALSALDVVVTDDPAGFFYVTNDLLFNPQSSGNPIEVLPTISEAGVTTEIKVRYKIAQNFPNNGYFVLQVPKANQYYLPPALFGASTTTSMASVAQLAGSATYTPFTTVYPAIISYAIDANTNPTQNQFDHIQVQIQTGGSVLTPSVSATQGFLEVRIPSFILPPSTKPVTQLTAFIASSLGPPALLTERAYLLNDNVLFTLTPSNPKSGIGQVSFANSMDGVGNANAAYKFGFTPMNPVPKGAFIEIVVSPLVTVPTNYATNFKATCTKGCTSSGATFVWTQATNRMRVSNIFPSYLTTGTAVEITITGWTNPETSTVAIFSLETMFNDGTADRQIDRFTGMSLSSILGLCQVRNIYVTDGDTRLYANPKNYTVEVACNHEVQTNYGLRLTFPEEFSIVPNSRCIFGRYNTRYFCQAFAETRKLEIFSFTDELIPAATLLNFTVDSIRNPSVYGETKDIVVQTLDSLGNAIDTGTFKIDKDYFTISNFTNFQVQPLTQGVGQFPVDYRFIVTPVGEMPIFSYFKIKIPKEIQISDETALESSCGKNLYAFTQSKVTCTLRDQDLYVQSGFRSRPTTNLTDDDGFNYPPTFYFDLQFFRNPRQTTPTEPWNITAYNQNDIAIYAWNQTLYPTTQVSGVAMPNRLIFTRSSQQNGILTDYDFLVTTTNYIQNDDIIQLRLPYGIYFSEDSVCMGRSTNLRNVLECFISIDLRQIRITVRLPFSVNRLLQEDRGDQRSRIRNLQQLSPGISFQFRVTNIKNPSSLEPTAESIIYQVYSSKNLLFEEQQTGMIVTNTLPGDLLQFKNGLNPSDFRTNFEANYTLEVSPVNYQQNMHIILTLPEQISFGSEYVQCTGLSGTDSEEVRCIESRQSRRIWIDNITQFQGGNPGRIRILISKLRNPNKNVISDSFTIETQSPKNFTLDLINNDVTVNFFCEYPCATCPQNNTLKDYCLSCYSSAPERNFFDNKCYDICPEGYVNTTTNNCTACEAPCAACTGDPTYCTKCIDGYALWSSGGGCREIVYWPFPYLCVSVVAFVVILVSEIVTKTRSNFKESFIAFLAVPEFLCWINLIAFMWYRIGTAGPTALAIFASIAYIIINFTHWCYHPREMVPHSLFSYKQLISDYKCGTYMLRLISYLFSFKFSLILVSYFFLSPRLSGDYSAKNWKQFNAFSIAFLLSAFPAMMLSCALFLYEDGFFSYPGFVALETIIISSILAVLQSLDVFAAIKCKTVGKAKTNKAIKVATGADYESEDDEFPQKRMLKKAQKKMQALRAAKHLSLQANNKVGDTRSKRTNYPNGQDDVDVYGDESYGDYGSEQDSVSELKKRDRLSRASQRSSTSQQTAIMNDEARKQIQMLEDLAEQMREEKRQLAVDRQKLEDERRKLTNEKETGQGYLDAYMNDYQRTTTALSNTVRELEKEKHELVRQVEDKLSEGQRVNTELVKQIQAASTLNKQAALGRRNFKDFEGEMDDYEPVEEEKSDEGSDSLPDIVETAQLPVKPGYGEIDYFRQMDGEDQHWMQQITPRAGGDSLLGQEDRSDEGQVEIHKQLAEFEDVSVAPTQHDYEVEAAGVEAEYQEMNSVKEQNDSEMFQQRSDGMMEIVSDNDDIKSIKQNYFSPEKAVFSQLDEKEEISSAQEQIEKVNALFEEVPAHEPIESKPEVYVEKVRATLGTAEKANELKSTQQFFAPETAAFGALLEDGEQQRAATAQQFFNPMEPTQGVADDHSREGAATSQEFIAPQNPHYDLASQNANPLATSQYMINNDQPRRDDLSDIMRNRTASEQNINNPSGVVSQTDNAFREQTGGGQEYMNRATAKYSQVGDAQQITGSNQEFFRNDEAIRGDITSQNKSILGTPMNFFDKDGAQFGVPADYERRADATQQQFISKEQLNLQKLAGGMATPNGDKSAGTIEAMHRSEAEYGRQSTNPQLTASQQRFFENEKNAAFGQGSQYNRGLQASQEFNPTPVDDETGRSGSSEGSIANHAPFNANTDLAFQQRPGGEEEMRRLQKEMPAAEQVSKKNKAILYSDKSETSVDDLMDDTPSNYNIQNGRFEGKSLGLKALLLHAKNYGGQGGGVPTGLQTVDPRTNMSLSQIPEDPMAGQRSPRPSVSKNQELIHGSGLAAAAKGIIGSQGDERQFISNLRRQEMDRSSVDGSAHRNTRNQVKTKKTFAGEGEVIMGMVNNGAAGQRMPPTHGNQSRSPMGSVATGRSGNQRLTTKPKKNNYV